MVQQRRQWRLDRRQRISQLTSRLPRLLVCRSCRPHTVRCNSPPLLLEQSKEQRSLSCQRARNSSWLRRAPKKVVSTAQASTSVGPAVDLTGSTPPRPSTPASAAELSPSKRLLRSSTPTGSPTKSVPTSAVASPGREGPATSTRSQAPQEASGTD